MDGVQIGSLVTQVGFPAAIAVYLLIRDNKNTDRYIQLATQASADSQASTEAIKSGTEAIKSSTEVIKANTAAFIELKTTLESQRP